MRTGLPVNLDPLAPAAALEFGEMLLKGELGLPDRVPLLVVSGSAGNDYHRLAERADDLPCIVAVVGDPEHVPPAGDLAFASVHDPPRPWIGDPCGAELERCAAAIMATPRAAITLVQLLRISTRLGLRAGLVAESLSYGLLQGGPEHRAWLDRRGPRHTRASRRDIVRIAREDNRLDVVLSMPERRNAYGAAMRDGLIEALDLALADPSLAEVHLHGEGPVFCSGGDLGEFGTVADPVSAHLIRSIRSVGALINELGPRMAVHVHGACAGAGIELSAFAHHVVAAQGASFRLPEVAMGLIPGAGGTVSIPRRIGGQRMVWMSLTGEPVDVSTALAWGLVDEIA